MADELLMDGKALSLKKLSDGIAEIVLDLKGESVNKFNRLTVEELRQAVDQVKGDSSIKGLMISSAKSVFVVGADITEFIPLFKEPAATLKEWLGFVQKIFNDIEDLQIPTLTSINGVALGGGFEICLSTTYRVMTTNAKVGLPETKLGIIPGWGGTVRLPRVIGADNAIEWIAGAKQYGGDVALEAGAVDAVVAPEILRDASLQLLGRAISGTSDWKSKRQEKLDPLKLITPVEATMVFEGGKGFVAAQAGPHYPAPVKVVGAMQKASSLTREAAQDVEVDLFIEMAKTPVAESLVGIFLADQFNKGLAKKAAKAATSKVERAGVLGAGIMGGGIAYQSASKGTPIVMKDIKPEALELGMGEASKLLLKQVSRKKMNNEKMAKVLGSITPTMSYGDLSHSQIIVEAVVENEKIKSSVLKEVEGTVPKGTVLASNTSTISITRLAEGLDRPEDFCGMHFFNPVHRMPLVEVIRGEKSSDHAVGQTVAYALSLGKTPIVVNDCPGFLVNRILFPYFAGLMGLLADGVDFQRIDKVMEKYGWPMGPSYLLDVVGLDAAVHAAAVMKAGFPDRMSFGDENAMTVLHAAGRLGQKSGSGFYKYELDRKGKPKKLPDPAVASLLSKIVTTQKDVSDEGIIDRMMIPMTNEAGRCLEEKIVSTPVEVDLGLIYGLGFPPFRGGLIKELDRMGASEFVSKCGQYKDLGKLYEPAPLIAKFAADGKNFYQV